MSLLSNSNGNGDSAGKLRLSPPRPAKWLDQETGQLPPVAFEVPLTDADLQFLGAAPSGEDGEKWVTQWATTEFKSRYAGALPQFEDEISVALDQVDRIEGLQRRCRVELDKIPAIVVTSRTQMEFPKEFLGRWLKFVSFLLCSQILLEWWNAATFARFELQDMLAALAFTYSMALAPIALKLFAGEGSRWKRAVFLFLSCGALFCFSHVFTDSYVTSNPNLTSDQLLNQIGQAPAQLSPFWQEPLNPRWRFMWQTILFTLIGFAFSNYLARHLNVVSTIEEKDNPAYQKVESRLKTLTLERETWGRRYADAEGNRREWEASIERHVLRCLALFQDEERRRRDEEALENFLKEKTQRRNNRLFNQNLNQQN